MTFKRFSSITNKVTWTSGAFSALAGLLFCGLVIYPFCFHQGSNYINGNMSWLMICAERLLSGGTMLGDAYETNPPLSILLYIPFVLLSKITAIAPENTFIPLTLFYLTLSTAATSYVLFKHYPDLSRTTKIAFIISFIVFITTGIGPLAFEREHYITIALIPFVIAQYAMHKGEMPKGRILWPIFLIGGIFLLIKPHYGIIPTAFILVRMIKNKQFFKEMLKPDFIALSIVTSLYILILVTLFRDYVFIILPDVVKLYYLDANMGHIVLRHAIFPGLIVFILLSIIACLRKEVPRTTLHFVQMLLLMSLLSFVTYFVQNRGYSYHIIAINSFAFIGITTFVISLFEKALNKRTTVLTISISILLCAATVNSYLPFTERYNTKQELKELPIARYLKENCKHTCSTYSFNNDMEIILPTKFSLGLPHGSRFANNWYYPNLLEKYEDAQVSEVPEYYRHAKERYTQYLLTDLKERKPEFLFFLHEAKSLKGLTMAKTRRIHYFIDFFFDTPELESEFDRMYAYKETIEFQNSAYFLGYMKAGGPEEEIFKYDVYERRENTWN